jgi:hypothetical protein
MNKKLTAILLLLMGATTLSAAIKEDGPRFTSIRQMAMGGTGIAFTFDEHALYRNPAALRLAKFDIDLPRLRAQIDVDTYDNLETFQDLFDANEVSEADAVLRQLIPSQMSLGFASSPLFSVTFPGFAVGAFTQADVTARFLDQVNPRVETEVQSDAGAYAGFAKRGLPFLGDKIMAGISAGLIARQSGQETFDAGTFANDEEFEFDLNETLGYTFNIGFLMPYEYKGTGHIALVANNLGGELSAQSDDSVDVDLDSTITIGIGHNAYLPFIGETLLAAEYDVDGLRNRDDFLFRLGLGVEKRILYDRILLRGGINDGYIVGGFGFDLWILQINYAYHAEELGDSSGERALEQHVIELGLLF